MDMYYLGTRYVAFHARSHDATYVHLFKTYDNKSGWRAWTWAYSSYERRQGVIRPPRPRGVNQLSL